MARAFLSPRADADVARIAVRIARDNPAGAVRFVEATFSSLALLGTQPEIGRPRIFKNPRLEALRSWRVEGFGNYLMFYRLAGGEVEVARVLHGAMNFEVIFGEPDELEDSPDA
ncbi:MAG: type II toxin-antitoxin system RelE/ParE family toxin [Verrucomicrobia bacterium]|nr:type II toxin-antitoxin system RelE/ParE family toxin [Verrucomicrobiota bacterium]